MEITLSNIATHRELLDSIKQLYFEAFPIEERRPWESIMRLISTNNSYNLTLIFADNEFAGFITSWIFTDFIYIEHFAIVSDKRGYGIGAQAISAFTRYLPQLPIILEAEPIDTSAIARRRIEFYQRQGFQLCSDFDYTQPPYSPTLPAVKLSLMIYSSSNDYPPLQSIATEIHHSVYGITHANTLNLLPIDCGGDL